MAEVNYSSLVKSLLNNNVVSLESKCINSSSRTTFVIPSKILMLS